MPKVQLMVYYMVASKKRLNLYNHTSNQYK